MNNNSEPTAIITEGYIEELGFDSGPFFAKVEAIPDNYKILEGDPGNEWVVV